MKKKPAPKKPTPRKRKSKTGTIAADTTTMQNASAQPLKPPSFMKLRPGDLPYWHAVIRARAREMWTDVDLIMAANLARAMNEIELQQAAIVKEGASVKNGKGTPVANPRFNAITQLTDRVTRMMRLLHVHPAATAGRAADEGARMRSEREAEDILDGDGLSAEDAALLATPGNVH
jgi:hypothetical protein